jgi:periplasmic protein TonB
MKYTAIQFLFILLSVIGYGQDTGKVAPRDSVFSKAEVQPDFDGGAKGWMAYLAKNLNANVPVDNKAPEGMYTVIIQFIVYEDGSIDSLKALTNHGYGMEKEVIRILKKSPKWKPALQNGKIVNAYRKQLVSFLVQY